MKLSPRTEALAFRVWQVANPRGWDMTAAEIADVTGIDYRSVGRICAAKGWGTLLRRECNWTTSRSMLPAYGLGLGASAADTIAHYASLAEASE